MTREEAIEKLKSQRNVTCNGCLHAVGWCESHCKFSEAIDMAIEALKQPEPCVDVVSRQSAINAINSWRREYPYDMHELIDDCENSIKELPKVEIVRCSDCEYCTEASLLSTPKPVNWCTQWVMKTESDWYCSRAERKADK